MNSLYVQETGREKGLIMKVEEGGNHIKKILTFFLHKSGDNKTPKSPIYKQKTPSLSQEPQCQTDPKQLISALTLRVIVYRLCVAHTLEVHFFIPLKCVMKTCENASCGTLAAILNLGNA